MWTNTTKDGAGRAAPRSHHREQVLRRKRRQASPEVRAVMQAFQCDMTDALRIIRKARREGEHS